jgi:cell division GTPase FtsZ
VALELSSILNFKSAFHVQTDVLRVRLVTIALNADLITLLMSNLDFALKSAVMEKDTLLNVMMETMSMVMDAARIAESKSASHALEVHQLQKTHAVLFFPQTFQLKAEANPDFMERSF